MDADIQVARNSNALYGVKESACFACSSSPECHLCRGGQYEWDLISAIRA